MGGIIFYKDKAEKGITLQRSHLHNLGLPGLARHMGGFQTMKKAWDWMTCPDLYVTCIQFSNFYSARIYGNWLCTFPWYKHSISFNNNDNHVSVDHVMEISIDSIYCSSYYL